MVINSMEHVVSLYNISKLELEPPKRFFGHTSSFYVRASIGIENQYIISGSSEGLVYLWDINVEVNSERPVGVLGGKNDDWYGHINEEVNEVVCTKN